MNLRLNFRLGFALVVALLMASCQKDPVTPSDERLEKLHGDPASARLTFETVRYDSLTQTYQRTHFDGAADRQVVTYELSAGQWRMVGDTVRVVTHSAERPVSYLLHIEYFDANSHAMNYQFVTNGQDVIHQHFFMPEKVSLNGKSQPELRRTGELYRYTYLDTDPHDREPGAAATKVLGATNPIGFRGVFQFTQPQARFDLFVWLLHSLNTQRGKYLNDARTEVAPYYRFTQSQLAGGAWDIQMPIPMQVAQ